MKSNARVCSSLVLLVALWCTTAAVAMGPGPQVTWTGDFFLIRFASGQGELVIQGRQMADGLEASASLNGGEVRQISLVRGQLTVRTGEGGMVTLTTAPDEPGLRLLACDLPAGRPGNSNMDRALDGLQQALSSNPGGGREQRMTDGLAAALRLALQFGYGAQHGETPDHSMADCMRQRRDCRTECENEFCWYDGCDSLSLAACYTLCDLEYISCGLWAIGTGGGDDHGGDKMLHISSL